jgi:hypothetical protein
VKEFLCTVTTRIGIPASLIFLCGCSWFGETHKPSWVDGMSSDYPPAQYLTGVGQGQTRSTADDQAYGALARIFTAQISAQSKDWETYLVVEERGQSRDERRLTLEHVTQVSTDKMLENVSIIDRWYDSNTATFYALAGMHRLQSETALLERIAELDRSIESDVLEVHLTTDSLAKVRGLRRAARNLILREAYNADLRVVRVSGQGTTTPYHVHELTHQLEEIMSKNLTLAVVISGDHVEPVRQALTEGLIKEGLQVVLLPSGDTESAGVESHHLPELLVRGLVRVWPIDIRDPYFRYVRWCSDFEVVERVSQRILGSISRGGKEGHLSDREAMAKVVRIMQHDMSSEVARAIAAHVYGEEELPAEAVRPAGCPRDGLGLRPANATH